MVIVIVTDFLAFVWRDTNQNESPGNQLIYSSSGIRKCVYSFLYVKKDKNNKVIGFEKLNLLPGKVNVPIEVMTT